ncbi:hypothetical protein CEXT_296171 [Caerostris extrusa]|uniref:Uncharacterized protein n=1 Tax=Caerostris extrusa TaxID=172846 RepID=A0AAV4X323_CAEEX|nr:hypothetical protein CEXT_296171 [Caerostris extrusa]
MKNNESFIQEVTVLQVKHSESQAVRFAGHNKVGSVLSRQTDRHEVWRFFYSSFYDHEGSISVKKPIPFYEVSSTVKALK